MTRQIKWRLTAMYLLVIFASLFFLGLALSYFVERQFIHEVETALNAHCQLCRTRIEDTISKGMDRDRLTAVCQVLSNQVNARVAVYDMDGRIIADSEGVNVESEQTRNLPEAGRELRERFGCRICHSEVTHIETKTLSLPIARSGAQIGHVELSASLYEAKRASGMVRRVILVTLVLTSLIAATVSMRLASGIARPISHMNRMARKMADGDLLQRVRAEGNDEVAELANSLNVMADRLFINLDQMAQEKDKMETILASMADGIVVTDKQGVITLFNRAAKRLAGLTASRAIGNEVSALKSIPGIQHIVQDTLDGKSPIRKEVGTTRPAERVVSMYSAPIRDQKGDIAGSVTVLQDVTEIRRQAEIRKDFVANVSHELRTPVASVRAIVGALESGAKDDPAEAERFLSSLDMEIERLSNLLNDLLNLSELEAGMPELERSRVNLTDLARHAVSLLEDKAEQRGVSVSSSMPVCLCTVADKNQMLQVLLNLVDNAVKYTSNGGSVIVSGAETEAEVTVSVKDTGIGIPPADLDRIFERFYRVDKARSRQVGGTGLGLSIVRDILDAHGGRIAVESEVGIGSTFTVALPKTDCELSESKTGKG